MSWLQLTPQQAIEINQTIDRFHEPYQWAAMALLAMFFSLEIFLPTKQHFESKFDIFYSQVKWYFILLMTAVALSQGITGGCVLQIPQNYLASEFLNRPYWYPYGVVFRENFPPSFEPFLRIFYFAFSLVTPYVANKFWNKRLRLPRLNLAGKNDEYSSHDKHSKIGIK